MVLGGSKSGFTLIEVCVAMAIAVVILGVATMALSGLQQEGALKRAAARIETQARQALLDAVTGQRSIEIALNAGALGGEGRLQVRRYGETTFRDPKPGESWEFSSTGICEPIEVRLSSEAGVIELGFDPLTGCAKRKSVIVKA